MFRFILPYAAAAALLVSSFSNALAVEVYLFKGAGDFSFVAKGLHFSKGLERITDALNEDGIHAELRRASSVDDAYRTILKRRPESVAFIGHSMGALASLAIAKRMGAAGIRVAYVGLIDIPGPIGVAGDNVEWVENYYSIHPVYGKLTNTRSHPNAKNIHVSGQIHTTMDDSSEVRNGMLSAIRKVHAKEQQTTPPQPETIMVENTMSPAAQQPASSQPPRLLKIDEEPVEAAAVAQPVQNFVGAQQFENVADQPPIRLPSVAGVAPASQPATSNVASAAPAVPASPAIDPGHTASVEEPAVIRAGKSLIGKARGFIAGINNRRIERANKFGP